MAADGFFSGSKHFLAQVALLQVFGLSAVPFYVGRSKNTAASGISTRGTQLAMGSVGLKKRTRARGSKSRRKIQTIKRS